VTKSVLPGAVAQVAQQRFVPYADNSEVIGN